jgi:HD-GYP domain-containing protein (c-di-GMP phosphodiesterase class II)
VYSIQEIFRKAEDDMYKRKFFESSCMRGKTVETIINTLNEKNKREEQHSVRVSELCKSIGENFDLTERKIHELKTAGLLHDIGKIAIEENILNKSDKRTPLSDDFAIEELRRHSGIQFDSKIVEVFIEKVLNCKKEKIS